MVVFDQYAAAHSQALIRPAARTNGIFLHPTVARQRLSRVQNSRLRSLGCIDELSRQCGDAAQMCQEIERGAFAGQQRPQRTGDNRNDRPHVERRTIGDLRFPRHRRIEPLERHVRDGFARQNSLRSRDDMHAASVTFINERGTGQIARVAQIFLKAAVN